MDKENEVQDELQVAEIEETADEQGNDTTDWKALALQQQGIAKRLKTKLAKASEKKPEQETIKETKTDDSKSNLLEKAFLRSAGITKKDEVDFALSKAKKWNVSVDDLVDDQDFQESLEKFRAKQANVAAVSGVQGDRSGSAVKETTEYWQSKGTPPTPDDVPNRAARQKIVREMMDAAGTGGKKFYND